jgi:hypothetical protein
MTLQALLEMAVTSPLQMLFIGLLVVRGAGAAISMTWAKLRAWGPAGSM